MLRLVLLFATIVILGPITATISTALEIFGDGLVHTADGGVCCPMGAVQLFNDPAGSPTTLEIFSGGIVGGNVQAFDDSVVTMSGGRIDTATGSAANIIAYDDSTIVVTGGVIETSVAGGDSAFVLITGGLIESGLGSSGNATVTLAGGSVSEDLVAFGTSSLVVRGGTFGYELFAQEGSTITIEGTDFMVDGVPVLYGPLSATSGTLTGLLASGDVLDNGFHQGSSTGSTGTILLVPEPSTALLFGLGSTILAALRRQSARSKSRQ